ncbi:MAG TPA: hypothetical protein PK868_01085 [Phycicoccus sp.]|nr:hypothetical protein [Phycicoccus sp.]HQH08773.1 hypothetical protein [Phycicoccus sp.]HQK33058.1 hypothetical protein [Phycicoccus sp.]HRA45422.1 hypothetical protein [Phycicoccus sp.]
MTAVLDSGGLSAIARERETVATLISRGLWPPEVPAVVLVECLTGDHRRDHATNRVIDLCMVREVSETMSRRAATLRTRTGRAASISAVDAVVVALAEGLENPTVITSDEHDVRDLSAQSNRAIRVLNA